uniref:Uncharacterized protein n=1 Tax=Romanomermis culicivorax TaxID=13658 RepID=A0A915HI33_ROMCU
MYTKEKNRNCLTRTGNKSTKVTIVKKKKQEDHHLKKRNEKATGMNQNKENARNNKSRQRKEEKEDRRWAEEGDEKDNRKGHKSPSRRCTPVYYQHEDHLDVSYSSQTGSLDSAKNDEVVQPGAPMCDPNAMAQAQQQQISYLLPNYPGLLMVGMMSTHQYSTARAISTCTARNGHAATNIDPADMDGAS